MDDKTISRLFEPCFTTKPDGEGLGLAIVSQIVDDHGGAMQVQSAAGATTFRIRLPLPQRKKTPHSKRGTT
jgi:nitrogen-specific signal transduction histidine kinase